MEGHREEMCLARFLEAGKFTSRDVMKMEGTIVMRVVGVSGSICKGLWKFYALMSLS